MIVKYFKRVKSKPNCRKVAYGEAPSRPCYLAKATGQVSLPVGSQSTDHVIGPHVNTAIGCGDLTATC